MNLKQLEAQLRKLVEVQLVSALPGQQPEDRIVQKLTAALESNAVPQADGARVAPNLYTLLVNADSLEQWKEPHLVETMIEVLIAYGQAGEIAFNTAPVISIAEDPGVPRGDFAVIASQTMGLLGATESVQNETPAGTVSDPEGNLPEGAFLIVEGAKIFQLQQTVINIGRRLDNHLVIDDPRVSRNHVQLRAIQGRFVLFDLGSSGGTFINGQRSHQAVLHPGDVVSLAGVSLIFGEDNPPPQPDLGSTAPLRSLNTDTQAAVNPTIPSTAKKK